MRVKVTPETIEDNDAEENIRPQLGLFSVPAGDAVGDP